MTIAKTVKYEGGNNTFIWKHPSEDFNALTHLIVSERQRAVFFINGHSLDSFGPGHYTLKIENIPKIVRYLKRANMERVPFHSEVYFINRTESMPVKWKTDSPVSFVEPTYGFSMSIGAIGEVSLKITDPDKLIIYLSGSKRVMERNQLAGFFETFLTAKIKAYIARDMRYGTVNVYEIDDQLESFSSTVRPKLEDDLIDYGVTIENFFISLIVKYSQKNGA